tara:strand:- start:307 stop:1155 length:849 start_codon:yes stop_codon:yes gene_type:complete
MKTELSPFDAYSLMTKAALMRIARADYDVKGSLLGSPLSNPKIAKNTKENGVYTFGLPLAPADESGFNTCGGSSAGCRRACLHTSGNPAYFVAKFAARKAKTVMYFKNRALFMAILAKEVIAASKLAIRHNMALAFRLNVTSDIKWEFSKTKINGVFNTVVDMIHSLAPMAKLYDYTKLANRITPEFYSLTFSLCEDNDVLAASELLRGQNVAVVFDTKRGHTLPFYHTINGHEFLVIDGDLTDYRPDDVQGVIVGLRAKGKAIGDTSGFVRKARQDVFMAV